jgi:hypothetical protein
MGTADNYDPAVTFDVDDNCPIIANGAGHSTVIGKSIPSRQHLSPITTNPVLA